MAQAPVVADASALIALAWVDQLHLLPALFGRIIVPPAVAAEATYRGSALPSWVEVHPLGRPVDARVSAARLGPGESEVLCLGLELKDAWLILDDGDARALAHELRIHVWHSRRAPRSKASKLPSVSPPNPGCAAREGLPLGPQG